ncbi:D-(-)-3-hydroxybutyrate oligomer hydrolase [soil metagenome]
MNMRAIRVATVATVLVSVMGGCGGGSSSTPNQYAQKPNFLTGEPTRVDYDGVTEGLLTGKTTSLAALTAFKISAGSNPTAADLRTLRIQQSYAGFLDLSPAGGFGTYYGILDSRANKGVEYSAVSDDGSGKQNVSMVISIPSHFDPDKACIVAAPSSGSNGVYDAVSVIGEWALTKGCAVVYTDKGTGIGGHDLDADGAYTPSGLLVTAGTRTDLSFNANLLGDNLASFRTSNPNRFALKHSHSKQNPEKDWGKYTLQSIRFAYYALNKHFSGKSLMPSNTMAIVSGVSNGGGAVLNAAEQDSEGLVNGVVAVEPQVNLPANASVVVKRGGVTVPNAGKPLLDYFTYANLYQPCAVQAAGLAASSLFIAPAVAANRCSALAEMGLVSGSTTAAQSADALAKLRAYGWEEESDLLHDSHFGFEFTNLVATNYTNAYARSSVTESICGYSVGGVGATTTPGAPTADALKQWWATGSGLASGPVAIINDKAKGGPARDSGSISVRTGLADYNVDGAACLRRLLTNAAVGTTTLSAAEAALAARVQTGMNEVRATGKLLGKPTIIVHGRADTLLPVNHASRPYTAFNKQQDSASDLHYYEVTDANHFDALVGYYPRVLVPLHVYGRRSLDLMYNRLRNGGSLPPSQVVRAVARASATSSLVDANVPDISGIPLTSNAISVSAGSVNVPN